MHTQESEIVRAAKILSATLLVGIGGIELFLVVSKLGPILVAETWVALAPLALGLWMLRGAWTGRALTRHLRAFHVWSSTLGVDTSNTAPAPHAESMPMTGTQR